MDTIYYAQITEENFDAASLDNFVRRQEVAHCWRKRDGQWALLPIAYVEDWDPEGRRRRAEKLLRSVQRGDAAYGAWAGETLVGFARLAGPLFGSRKQYMDLAQLHVSAPFRNRGIGRELFGMVCRGARERGGRQALYLCPLRPGEYRRLSQIRLRGGGGNLLASGEKGALRRAVGVPAVGPE